MKRATFYLLILVTVALISSCSRSITPYEAANGRAKCGRTLR